MAFKYVDRAKVNTSTTGTGTVTLGSAVTGYQTLAAAGIVNGDTFRYLIEDGNAWEIGTGTSASSNTTMQRSIIDSSTGSLLNLSGSATVAVIASSYDFGNPSYPSGSVMSWNGSDVQITHSSNFMLATGGQWQWQYNVAASAPLLARNTADAASVAVAQFDGDRATPTDNDEVYVAFRLSNDAGEQTEMARITVRAEDVSDGTEDGYLEVSARSAGSFQTSATFYTFAFRVASETIWVGQYYDHSNNITVVDYEYNEALEIDTEASAVNHIRLTNKATGSGPSVQAVGDDTNIDLNLTPKGTGVANVGGPIKLTEQTAPSAPAANTVLIYAQDNGAGKTQLMALFPSGAAQQIAIEP